MKTLSSYVKVVDGTPVKFVRAVVYSFILGDVEDPDLYAAEPLHHWMETDAARWVIQHAADTPSWHKMADPQLMGYRVCVVADLKESDAALYVLKWC